MKPRPLLTLILVLLQSLQLPAFVPRLDTDGQPLRWDMDHYVPPGPGELASDQNPTTLAIRFHLPKISWSTENHEGELNAVRAAFAQWEKVPGTKIRFEESYSISPNGDVNPFDGINMVTWLPGNQFICKGSDAQTYLYSSAAAFTCLSLSSEPGIIAEADIVLNGSQNWHTDFDSHDPGAIFVESVVLHEIGHLLGLNHSPVGGATMFWFTPPGVGTQAGLSEDEFAAARSLYGTSTTSSHIGMIQGAIRMNGKGILGALVIAEDLAGNIAGGTVSSENGHYELTGLIPGVFTVRVCPLDSSVNGQSFLVRGFDLDVGSQNRFEKSTTAFLPSIASSVTVTANGKTVRDFSVTAGEPSFRITDFRTSLSPEARSSGDIAQQLKPGIAQQWLGVFIPRLSASTANLQLSGNGVMIGPTEIIPNALRDLTLVQAPITVASNAIPGLRSLSVSANGSTAWANGFVEILPTFPDFNLDGLDDRFQRRYFQPFTRMEANPDSDPDGDGWPNRREAQLGSDPTDKNSIVYHILEVRLTSNGKGGTTGSILWESLAGKKFQLSKKTNLSTGGWVDVGSPIVAIDDTSRTTDPNPGEKISFYRVKVVQ